MFLPTDHPSSEDRAVGERLTSLFGGAVISGVEAKPVETESTNLSILDYLSFILDSRFLDKVSGTEGKTATCYNI